MAKRDFYSSPNYDERNHAPRMIIMHYTGMENGDLALRRLCDSSSKVSAHYIIMENGRHHCLVAEESRAWHAGVSYWDGETDINDISIGIELVNEGHEGDYHSFSKSQMNKVLSLCEEIVARWKMDRRCILAHGDVAPSRRMDPGELFDWRLLAARSLGVMPSSAAVGVDGRAWGAWTATEHDWFVAADDLAAIGYDVTGKQLRDKNKDAMQLALLAFQRHYMGWGETNNGWSIPCALTRKALGEVRQLWGR